MDLSILQASDISSIVLGYPSIRQAICKQAADNASLCLIPEWSFSIASPNSS